MSDFAILRKRSSIKSFRKNTFGAFNEFIPASYVRFGSFSDLGVRDDRVRFAPMTGHRQPDRARPKSANGLNRSRGRALLRALRVMG
jgi:hypothetical protein